MWGCIYMPTISSPSQGTSDNGLALRLLVQHAYTQDTAPDKSPRSPTCGHALLCAPILRSFQSQPDNYYRRVPYAPRKRGSAPRVRGARACALRSVRVRSCVRLRGWPFITANRCRVWHTHSFAATERECPSPETASDRIW